MTLIRVWERRSLGAPCLVDKKEQFGGFFTLTRCTLSDVPDFIPPDTRHVTLHWNKLTRIPPGVFSHLSSCTKLEVAYNRSGLSMSSLSVKVRVINVKSEC